MLSDVSCGFEVLDVPVVAEVPDDDRLQQQNKEVYSFSISVIVYFVALYGF